MAKAQWRSSRFISRRLPSDFGGRLPTGNARETNPGQVHLHWAPGSRTSPPFPEPASLTEGENLEVIFHTDPRQTFRASWSEEAEAAAARASPGRSTPSAISLSSWSMTVCRSTPCRRFTRLADGPFWSEDAARDRRVTHHPGSLLYGSTGLETHHGKGEPRRIPSFGD